MSWTYDDFTGTNGDNPKSTHWAITEPSSTTVDIQSNALRINVTGGAASKAPAVTSTILLYGDPVDIQIDFSALTEGADYNYAGLAIWDNSSTKIAYIQAIQLSGAKKWRSAYNYGSWVYPTTSARTNNNGKLRLKRTGTTVETWYQDGGGSWTHLDTITGFLSAATELEFHAAVYAGTGGNPTCTFDNLVVNDGSINLSGGMTAASLSMGAFLHCSWTPYAELALPAPDISALGTASPLATAAFALPLPGCLADTPVQGKTSEALPPLSSDAAGNVSLVYEANITMPGADADGALFTGQVGNASAGMPPPSADILGGNAAAAALPAALMSSSGFSGSLARADIGMPPAEANAAGFLNLTLAAGAFMPSVRLRAVFLDGASCAMRSPLPAASATAAGFRGIVASSSGSSSILSAVSLKGAGYGAYTLLASMALPALRSMASLDALRRRAVLTAVLNAKTGGVTTYDGCPFDSYAVFGGSTLGAGKDGIYLLDGPDDDGADIAASFRTAPLDLGLPGLKRLRELHLTMTSTGPLTVKVISDDGLTRYYTAPSTRGVLGTERVKTGRGVRGRRFSIEVQNVDGCDMEIERMEAAADVTGRRI
jgi:hypothetical protein